MTVSAEPDPFEDHAATRRVAVHDAFEGGGLMGARMRAHDWAASPLGAAHAWPQSLKTAVRIMLTSRFAMWMAWGPELVFFCNDAYLPTTGVKRDWVLGARSDRVWREIWSDIGPRIEHVLRTAEATWDEQLLLYLERNGFVEETYHTFSYSPLADDAGATAGMLCVVAEVTERVIGERQLGVLRDLGARLAAARTRGDAMAAVESGVALDPSDLPFVQLHLRDPSTGAISLTASVPRRPPPVGAADDAHAAADANVHAGADADADADADDAPWPFAEALASGQARVAGLARLDLGPPRGAGTEPVDTALVLPIGAADGVPPLGFMVAGLSPHRAHNDDYRGFLQLLAAQIAAALRRADDYEQAHARVEALAEIDRAKTAFFSNVSHEFRTPLTLMLGPLEDTLAEAAGLPPVQAERLAMAHRNGQRLLRLVNSLLDFSRLEAGRSDARFVPVELAAFTAELASTFRSVCERAGLTLTVACERTDEPVWVDRTMWEKIVLNLLSNAFKFTLEGGIAVRLRPDGRHVVLSVADTGVGIPASELPRLFERFHRIEGSGGRSFEGSGIGLALVHELVRLHGANVTVESEEGRGSVFTVHVPLGFAHLPAERVHAEDSAPAGAGAASLAGLRAPQAFVDEAQRWVPGAAGEALASAADLRDAAAGALGTRAGRVLLADDNADLRDYVGALLAAAGHRVEAVADGEAALAAARARRPDLVLTDVMMPRLDGVELLAALRADPSLADVPVVMLSARAGEESKVEGLDAGADDYLAKPFSARELLARVASNLTLGRVRRESAEALRASEARLRDGLEEELRRRVEERTRERDRTWNNSQDLLLVVDQQGRFRASNPAWLRILGWQMFEVVGRGHLDFIHPDDHAASLGALAIARTHVLRRFENRYRHRDGSHRLIAWVASPEGDLIYATGRDVTAEREAAAALSRAEARIRSIFETTYQLQGFLMPDGRLEAANPAALAVIECGLDAVKGRPFWDTPWFEQTPGMADLIRAAVQEVAAGRSVRRELALQLAGVARLFDFSMRPVADAAGRVIGIVPEAVELTDHRRAEEALHQAQKMEAVGRLTGGIAHDFNNMLAVVIGSLELLSRRGAELDPRLLRFVEGASAGARRAAQLTRRLMTFSRQEPLKAEPVDLNSLVDGMTELLARSLGSDVRVTTVASPALWLTHADPNQLENVILNLAVNARDAMPGGGQLAIETANVLLPHAGAAALPGADGSAGEYVALSIRDSGVGMTPDVVARAFEPFFTTKGVGQGTGLGLSQVYGFVRQSGGEIDIVSAPGAGTTVRICLRRLNDAVSRPNSNPAPAAASGVAGSAFDATLTEIAPPPGADAFAESRRASPPDAGKARRLVLVVDDEPAVRAMSADALAELGYGVLQADSAAAALALVAERHDVDLVFTDIVMPDVSGRQLAEALRLRRPTLPVLFTTGFSREDPLEANGLAADEVVAKPFSLDELGRRVRARLDGAAPRAPWAELEDRTA